MIHCFRYLASRCSFNGVHLPYRIAISTAIKTVIDVCICIWYIMHPECMRGIDKSLARGGRKQATATKLGINSTYFSRSSVHFSARCSNFCKPLKKFRILSVQPHLHGSNDLRVRRKITIFQLFFCPVNRWKSDGARSGE